MKQEKGKQKQAVTIQDDFSDRFGRQFDVIVEPNQDEWVAVVVLQDPVNGVMVDLLLTAHEGDRYSGQACVVQLYGSRMIVDPPYVDGSEYFVLLTVDEIAELISNIEDTLVVPETEDNEDKE